jgi:hypothetical protein
MFPDFCHNEAQARAARAADAILAQDAGKARAANDAAFKERLYPPDKITAIADARQSAGKPLLADDNGELLAPERAAESSDARLRAHIKRHEYYTDLTRPCHSADAHERRAKRGLQRLPTVRNSFEREVIAAAIDDDLRLACHDLKRRRDQIAAALNVSVSAVTKLIKRGRLSLDKASQMAAAADTAKPVVDQPISAPSLAAGTTLPNLALATRGTQFDSRERRAGIAALSAEEQREFVTLLVRQAVEGDIDATDALDRKQRAKRLPESILGALDDCDRNRDDVRRMLASLDHDERKRLCAEWTVEAVDNAIAGTPSQRQAARNNRTNLEYAEMARAWVKRQREKASS